MICADSRCAHAARRSAQVWAGAFTLNQVAAAPVQYCRARMAESTTARGVLINAGQANAATGDAGTADSAASAAAVGAALGIPPGSILLESTGVIGQRIKMDPFLAAVPTLVAGLSNSRAAADAAATAITTTDLVRKAAALETTIGGATVRVGGMCKGSGMIHPNMATMLAALTCDAAVSAAVWRPLVTRAVQASFNQITVDGDTSTNDTVIAFASGAAGNKLIDNASSPEAAQLEAAVTALLAGLAKSVASDGEGATVLMEISCSGAKDLASAQKVARSVAGSDLFKAAVFGRDPNWGRIAAAAGYAGVPFDQTKLRIALGPHLLMDKGQPLQFDAAAASGYMKAAGEVHGTVRIDVSIGDGPGTALAWGCDLSYGALCMCVWGCSPCVAYAFRLSRRQTMSRSTPTTPRCVLRDAWMRWAQLTQCMPALLAVNGARLQPSLLRCTGVVWRARRGLGAAALRAAAGGTGMRAAVGCACRRRLPKFAA